MRLRESRLGFYRSLINACVVLLPVLFGLLCVTASPSYGEDCQEWGYYEDGEPQQGTGCYVYCVLGEEWYTVWCPLAEWTAIGEYFWCGDRVVSCPWPCKESLFYDRMAITCECWVTCAQNYQLRTQYYSYNFGDPHSCDVCPMTWP